MKRITIVLACLFFLTAAFSTLDRIYSQKFLVTTGAAQWIWAQHRMSANEPVAFFAARDFELPAKRVYTRLKIAGDPEYALYVNGREIAGRRASEDPQLDFYDISELVQTGRNRIVVAIRAPQGVGGLIASIDIAPETENWIVTDGSWKIYRRWRPDLLPGDVANLPSEPPMIIGAPPIGRWNYLTLVPRQLAPPPARVLPSRDAFSLVAILPAIRTVNGVAVAVTQRARASAFDFGFTRGHLRLIRDRDQSMSRLVNVRFAFARNELGLIEWNLRPIVFAPGELAVTTPEVHNFRYALVFGRGVTAEVVQ